MAVQQRSDLAHVEERAGEGVPCQQQVPCHGAEPAPEPQIKRNAEPHLGPVDYVLGQTERGDAVFQQQVQAIAEYLKSKQKPDKPDELKLTIKPIVPIKPASIVKKSYLETQADVDEFVGQLQQKLSDEIAKNNRVRVE